jgi:hypothetical protein
MKLIELNNDANYKQVAIHDNYPSVTIVKESHSGSIEMRQVHIPEFKGGANLSLSKLEVWSLAQAGYRLTDES